MKYEEERAKTVDAYNEMRAVGETATATLMALALTNDGEAAAYAHLEPGEPSA